MNENTRTRGDNCERKLKSDIGDQTDRYIQRQTRDREKRKRYRNRETEEQREIERERQTEGETEGEREIDRRRRVSEQRASYAPPYLNR